MVDTTKTIEIVTTYKDQASGKIKKTVNSITQLQNGVKKTTKTVTDFSKQLNKTALATARTMRMMNISMMVGGYAIMRTFKTMATSAIDSFNQIMNTNGFMKTNIQALAASWEFLKFTIGSALNTALGPLLPKILEIVNNIASWIEQHPKLSGAIIFTMIVVGGLIGMLGLLGYSIDGIKLGLAAAGGAFTKGGFLSGLISLFGWIVAIVGAFFALKGVWDQLNASSGEGIEKGITFGKVLGFIAQVATFFFKQVYWGARIVTAGFMETLATIVILAAGTVLIIENVINGAISLIVSFINFLIRGINMAIDGLNRLGARISRVPELSASFKIDTSGAKAGIDEALALIKKQNDALMTMPDLATSWKESAPENFFGGQSPTAGTTMPSVETPGGLSSAGMYGQSQQTVGQGVTINMNNNFSGVGKDTTTAIQEGINKAFQQAYQTAKQYQT